MNPELSLKIEREFDAPRQKVWDAWTQPEQLRRWSCPDTFEVTELMGDLRVGGMWTETMVSETMGFSGTLRGEYKVLQAPYKLVSTHEWVDSSGNDGAPTQYSVELAEADGKTQMVFTQTGFVSPESRESHEGGWGSSFKKLTTVVEEK